MRLPLYQVDAFAEALFGGNPAAVCVVDSPLPETTMQAIAAENNLAETAFIERNREGLAIRWFTPTREVHLCGHATLAAAWVWQHHYEGSDTGEVTFTSISGPLHVGGNDDGSLTLDFPRRPYAAAAVPTALSEGLNVAIQEAVVGDDWLLRLHDADTVRRVAPDLGRLNELDRRGVIVTAEGEDCDFVSRFFAPKYGVAEDPVTGSAHCTLTPFWSERLGQDQLSARQCSHRGGRLWCGLAGERVHITGTVVPYLEGTIAIPESAQAPAQ